MLENYFTNATPPNFYVPPTPNINVTSFQGIIDFFTNFFTMIFAFIDSLLTTADNLVNYLLDLCDLIGDMTSSCVSGSTGGFPILEAVGCYRWFVGDFIFYVTYLFISIGLMLTIWHVVKLIYNRLTNSMSIKGGSLLNVFSKLGG